MSTDTSRRRNRAAEFLLRAGAWSLAIFGLLRLEWVGRNGLLPLLQLQGCVATGLCGPPTGPITATLACSGADMLALCLGPILAYPVGWRTRLLGAGCGLAIILSLNTLRIGTLGRLAASPSSFEAFHVFIWPALLTFAVAGYVFAWMRFADRKRRARIPRLPAVATPTASGERGGFRPTRRFALLTAAFLLIFTAAAPLYLQSAVVLSVAAFIARGAASVLRVLGVEAQATANQLWTSRGSFLVTQECISTPLIPIYLAAVIAATGTWRTRLAALLAAPPLFIGLGIARLLVVAIPPSLAGSPATLIHAFFQILLAMIVVFLAALWRHHDRGPAMRRALLAIFTGSALMLVLGSPYSSVILQATRFLTGGGSRAAGMQPDDPQGALALLPSFQAGLFLALWLAARAASGWDKFAAGLALLCLFQVASIALFPLFAGAVGASLQVQGVRAWAVAAPLLVAYSLRLFAPPVTEMPRELSPK